MNVSKEQLCTTTLYMGIDSYSTWTNSGEINKVEDYQTRGVR